jgi:hypothetical protein
MPDRDGVAEHGDLRVRAYRACFLMSGSCARRPRRAALPGGFFPKPFPHRDGRALTSCADRPSRVFIL